MIGGPIPEDQMPAAHMLQPAPDHLSPRLTDVHMEDTGLPDTKGQSLRGRDTRNDARRGRNTRYRSNYPLAALDQDRSTRKIRTDSTNQAPSRNNRMRTLPVDPMFGGSKSRSTIPGDVWPRSSFTDSTCNTSPSTTPALIVNTNNRLHTEPAGAALGGPSAPTRRSNQPLRSTSDRLIGDPDMNATTPIHPIPMFVNVSMDPIPDSIPSNMPAGVRFGIGMLETLGCIHIFRSGCPNCGRLHKLQRCEKRCWRCDEAGHKFPDCPYNS
ncbi:hypothetical protein NHQ30_000457 [Ciborinia camelliae]|nr:hypothetical protein NHQ30_000457 [Ciborinia camelliae]